VLYSPVEGQIEWFQTAKVTSKVTQGHVWFLLIFHCNCLSCTVSEILTLISQNFSRSYDPEYTPKLQNLLLLLDAMLAGVYAVVRPSVTSRHCIKTAKHRITQTTPHDSPRTLVFWCQKYPRISTGVIPYGNAKCRWCK